MPDAEAISDELIRMKEARADAILERAVARIHASERKYDWVGIYLLRGEELILHNFIGRATDHLRIPVGRGVCGTAVAEDRDINVPDVGALENYLACSAETRSEIVVLIRDGERVLGQIDIDSDTRGAFDERDERELRKIADTLGGVLADKLRHDQ